MIPLFSRAGGQGVTTVLSREALQSFLVVDPMVCTVVP